MSLDAELIINLLPVFFFPEYFSITPHDPWPVCVKVQTQTLYQCNWHVHVISVYSTLIMGLIKDCSIFSPPDRHRVQCSYIYRPVTFDLKKNP